MGKWQIKYQLLENETRYVMYQFNYNIIENIVFYNYIVTPHPCNKYCVAKWKLKSLK